MCCANVEIEKVCYSPIAHTIDDIAQRSANDRADGSAGIIVCYGALMTLLGRGASATVEAARTRQAQRRRASAA